MKFIVAGTHEQFLNYRSRYPMEKDFSYVSDASSLRGFANPMGVFVGTWYLRPDIDDIIQIIFMASRDGPSPGAKLALQQLKEFRDAQQQ